MFDQPTNLEYEHYKFLNLEGIRYIKEQNFINPDLNKVRDLFMLSIYTGGLDIKEFIISLPEHYLPGMIIINQIYGNPFPYPFINEAKKIIDKYAGKYYALDILEEKPKNSIDLLNKAKTKEIYLNNYLNIISTYLNLTNPLKFEEIDIIWNKLARYLKIDKRAINLVSEINNNKYKRSSTKENLELLNKSFNEIYHKINETFEEKVSFSEEIKEGNIIYWG